MIIRTFTKEWQGRFRPPKVIMHEHEEPPATASRTELPADSDGARVRSDGHDPRRDV